MKTFIKIILVLVILVVLLFIISLFLPRKIRVERAMLIKAPVHVVFNQINDVRNWENWSPWHQIDTAMEITYFGNKHGEGSGYEWRSSNPQVGNGKLTITASVLFDSIATEMDFMEQGTASAYYLFDETDSGTNVIWGFETDMGSNPIARYMGLMMDKMIGNDYEKGLSQLSEVCMSLPEYEIKEVDLEEINYLGLKTKCPTGMIGEKMGQLFGELMSFTQQTGTEVKKAPICVYYSYNDKETEFEVGLPVDSIPELSGNIKGQKIKAGKYIKTTHYGPYDGLPKAYAALQEWLSVNNKSMAGYPWEKYVTDPQMEPDPRKWITKIYFPVQ